MRPLFREFCLGPTWSKVHVGRCSANGEVLNDRSPFAGWARMPHARLATLGALLCVCSVCLGARRDGIAAYACLARPHHPASV